MRFLLSYIPLTLAALEGKKEDSRMFSKIAQTLPRKFKRSIISRIYHAPCKKHWQKNSVEKPNSKRRAPTVYKIGGLQDTFRKGR